jgi:hypothetical protein
LTRRARARARVLMITRSPLPSLPPVFLPRGRLASWLPLLPSPLVWPVSLLPFKRVMGRSRTGGLEMHRSKA